MTTAEQKPINRESITTIAHAFRVLGIVDGVSTEDQIKGGAFPSNGAAVVPVGKMSGITNL